MYYILDKKKENMKSWQTSEQLSNSLLKEGREKDIYNLVEENYNFL